MAVIPFLTARTPGRVASLLRSRAAALDPSSRVGEPEEEILTGFKPNERTVEVVNEREELAVRKSCAPWGWEHSLVHNCLQKGIKGIRGGIVRGVEWRADVLKLHVQGPHLSVWLKISACRGGCGVSKVGGATNPLSPPTASYSSPLSATTSRDITFPFVQATYPIDTERTPHYEFRKTGNFANDRSCEFSNP